MSAFSSTRIARRFVFSFAIALTIAIGFASLSAQSPVVGRNVDVIGGPTFINLEPGTSPPKIRELMGDPNRAQNVEPDCDVDSRNHAVVVCTDVDYSLVDYAGVAGGVHLDSWIGVKQSRDGGTTFAGRLHDGHPLDPHPNVLSKYQYAFDPQFRFGAAGLGILVGGVANRDGASGALFSSTWIHLSDLEDDLEPVKMVDGGITEIAKTNSGQMQDRPSLAMDSQPNGRTCTFNVTKKNGTVATQAVPCTTAYLTYATFLANRTKFHFTKTLNGGKTWTQPVFVSESQGIGQFAQVVKIPNTQKVLFFWRRGFSAPPDNQTDAIMMAVSNNDGNSFSKATLFRELCPFDEDTTVTRFRFRSMPQVGVDGTGKAYVVWHERPRVAGQCSQDDSRVFIATTDGTNSSTPTMVDPRPGVRGQQIFPTVAAAAGKVHVAWMDFRNDASGCFEPVLDEANSLLRNSPPCAPADGVFKRHTADMYARQGTASSAANQNPAFTDDAFPLSRYIFGTPHNDPREPLEPLLWNVKFARNFGGMMVPFDGDMNSNRGESIVPKDPIGAPGTWTYNGAPGSPVRTPVFHSFWTDGRHLKLFSNEPDFSQQGITTENSLYDPTQPRPACDPVNSRAGTKNLEIYTARTTEGLYAFAPWNNKAMINTNGRSKQRAFVIVAENTVPAPRFGQTPVPPTPYRLSVAAASPGTIASWKQFGTPKTTEDVFIAAGTAIARTLYVSNATEPQAAVKVLIEELTGIPGDIKEGGRKTTVFLNPDRTAPLNPLRPGNVDQNAEAFDITKFEVHDIEISQAEAQDINEPSVPNQGPYGNSNGWPNPGWENPGWENPGWENPGWENPGWENPGWENPGWENPGWENGSITDGDLQNGSYRQVRAQYTSTGNTTSAYDVRIVVNGAAQGLLYQLIAYKLYTTTGENSCYHSLVGNTQVLVNIPDYDPSASNLNSPPPESPQNTTIYLHPGETVYTVLVAFDPTERFFVDSKLPVNSVLFAARPQAVNTAAVDAGVTTPPLVFNGGPLALDFAVQPNDTSVNTRLGYYGDFNGIQVEARNSQGTPIPFWPITLAIGNNAGPGGTLAGTKTRMTDQFGVATFDDLTIDKSGSGYTLVASAQNAVNSTSAAFDITPLEGFASDPTDDAADPADLVSAHILVDGGNMQVDVIFNSVDPATSNATFMLDTDQDLGTGHPGIDGGCSRDTAFLGTDYFIAIGANDFTPAQIVRYNVDRTNATTTAATCNDRTVVGTATISPLTNGYRVTVPLSLLGNDDGRMNFKVESSLQLVPGPGFTGILDVMPDEGSPAAFVTDQAGPIPFNNSNRPIDINASRFLTGVFASRLEFGSGVASAAPEILERYRPATRRRASTASGSAAAFLSER